MSIVHKIESCLPTSLVEFWRLYKKYRAKQKQYARKIEQLRQANRSIRVCFFALDASVWKYDSLYRLMAQDPMFEPTVLVCPIVNAGRKTMLHKMDVCYNDFVKRGYKVLRSYDEQTDSYVDVASLSLDIVLYTNPYHGLIDDRYYIDNIKDALTCFVNYTFAIIPYKWAFAQPLQQLVWTYFCETDYHKDLVLKFTKPLHPHCVALGYPIYDEFHDAKRDDSMWKSKDKSLKRIIWAPHHSIFANEENEDDVEVRWSTFLLYSEFMVQMAKKYQDKVQFIFKPHPILRQILYKHPDWGVEKTDAYYELWQKMPNTDLSEAGYVELFTTSDAIIHDSGSFTIEYLYMRKPCMWLSTYADTNRFNHVGCEAFNCYYKGLSEADIEDFIQRIIEGADDPMRSKREKFAKRYLQPPMDLSAAQNMLDYLKKQIGK